jgi:hypothetical protein
MQGYLAIILFHNKNLLFKNHLVFWGYLSDCLQRQSFFFVRAKKSRCKNLIAPARAIFSLLNYTAEISGAAEKFIPVLKTDHAFQLLTGEENTALHGSHR